MTRARTRGSRARFASTVALLAACAVPVLRVPAAAAVPDSNCVPTPGDKLTATPWAQTRLNYESVWSITKGAGVRVAVVDSGIDAGSGVQPQVGQIHVVDRHNIRPGENPNDTTDCVGHGTGVAGIIAAPHLDGDLFDGVAPDASLIVVKQSGSSLTDGNSYGIAAGIRYAVDVHARVINLSVKVDGPDPVLEQAVAYAQQKGVVIVAVAGNDGSNSGLLAAAYPAAYASKYDNVIAVAAVDAKDTVTSYSDTGDYIAISAPGDGVIVPARRSGYVKESGTSFAAPFVTGTVALMLSAHPNMTPVQVRNRLEATADPPAATVPSNRYGYGIVNPYLAVTSIRDDSLTLPTPARLPALAPPVAPKPPDRHLQHVALAAGLGLVGLAALMAAGAAVIRRAGAAHAQRQSAA